MATGSLTLAFALLLANAGPPDTTYMSSGQFQIPIKINPERRNDIKELILYVSRDQGKSWAPEARVTPDKPGFPFYAANDGSYWFSVATVDRQNRQDPVDIYQAPVNLKVVVDTRKPDVRIPRAERRGDEVLVQWDVRDDNPDLATFRLEYRTADGTGVQWIPVSVQPALQGETTFRPAGQGGVQVRVLMNDLAGNQGILPRDVMPAGTAVSAPEIAGAMPGTVPPPATPPGAGIMPLPQAGQAAAVPPAGPPGDPPVILSPGPAGTPVGDYRPSLPSAESTSRIPGRAPDERAAGPAPVNAFTPPPPPQQTLAQSDAGRQVIQPAGTWERADRASTAAVTPYGTPAGSRGTLPPVEVLNKPQAPIDFQVGKYGPSGLGSVEVYVSTDDGATWTLSPGDRNVTLPPQTDARGGTPVTGSVQVELKQEGVVYGYFIVVKSRAGLGKKPPEPGTPPQIRLEMDITPPSAELYVPQPDPTRRDTLVLSWKATDKNLANNPVTLEWAERPDGQWIPIGPKEMANTGQYAWQVPATAPPSVYLRLAVRDVAGNVAVAQTKEPVLVDLSVPEVGGVILHKAGGEAPFSPR